MKIFSEEEVGTGRQVEFDCAKALAIVFMVIIHVYEQLSTVDTLTLCTDWFDVLVQFLGGPLSAPVFMTALGVGIVYSSRNQPEGLIKRGVHILLLGYLLNFLRGGVLMLISTRQLLGYSTVFYTFNVDILQFAGLAFIFTGLMKKLRVPPLALGLIAVLMQCAGQILSDHVVLEFGIGRCLLGLFFCTGEESYFPFLSWYAYPAAGILLGKILRHVSDPDLFYRWAAAVSAVFLTGYCFFLASGGYELRALFGLTDHLYYKQGCLHLLFSIPLVLLDLSACHVLCRRLSAPILDLVKYMSTNLNRIYIVQWVLICWTDIPLVWGVLPLVTPPFIVPAAMIYLVLTILILKRYDGVKRKRTAIPEKK